MPTELKSALNVELGWTWRDRVGGFFVADSNRFQFSLELADGAGSGQADVIWRTADVVLPAGESLTLHLGGLELDLFGDTLTLHFAKVKALLIVNRSQPPDDSSLSVGGAGVNPWSAPFSAAGAAVRVMPGSPLLLSNLREGWAVDAAHEALQITAVEHPATFDIAVLGVSVAS
jgi:hypothetical protein